MACRSDGDASLDPDCSSADLQLLFSHPSNPRCHQLSSHNIASGAVEGKKTVGIISSYISLST